MGFKENLKSELTYSGMLVKELAALSGVNKRTIDNYLNTHNCMPSAEAAVRIASVLGVTVEYLITGHLNQEKKFTQTKSDSHVILRNIETLNKRDRKIVLKIIDSMHEI